jgi:hypothetical protein
MSKSGKGQTKASIVSKDSTSSNSVSSSTELNQKGVVLQHPKWSKETIDFFIKTGFMHKNIIILPIASYIHN